jgi:hypothetical protein
VLVFVLGLLQDPAVRLEAALSRAESLDRELRAVVRRAVHVGAVGGPLDQARARAALAAVDRPLLEPEYRSALLLGPPGARRFVLSEIAAWRHPQFTGAVVAAALTAEAAADRRAAVETLRALADPDAAVALIPEMTQTLSDARRRRALELAAEFGDLRLIPHLVPRLGPAVRARDALEASRAAGGPAAVAASESLRVELEGEVDRLLAALRRCSGRNFGADWRAWEAWARAQP